MAQVKITDLVNLAAPALADLLEIVDDVAGTPTSKKVTLENLFKALGVGSDADGDTYYRAAGALARLAKGAAGAVSGMSDAQVPSYRTLKVSDAGQMTNANQPSFLAVLSGAQADVTGDATSYNITGAIWTEIADRGADFSDGTFTAPVTGLYQFSGIVGCDGVVAAHTHGTVTLVTSNRSYVVFQGDFASLAGISEAMTPCFSQLCDLDAADVAYLNVTIYNGTKVVDITINTYFEGVLIC